MRHVVISETLKFAVFPCNLQARCEAGPRFMRPYSKLQKNINENNAIRPRLRFHYMSHGKCSQTKTHTFFNKIQILSNQKASGVYPKIDFFTMYHDHVCALAS